MSRFSPCRATDLQGVVRDCAGKCMNRGVRSNCPCTDIRIVGGQILTDPSFELGPQVIAEDTNLSPPPSGGWLQSTGGFGDADMHWRIERSGDLDFIVADEGISHARMSLGSPGTPGAYRVPIQAYKQVHCIYGTPYSAAVSPGDLVTFTIREAAVQGPYPTTVFTGDPEGVLFIQWLDDTMGSLGFTSLTPYNLTGTYATYSTSGMAPSGAAFCRAYHQCRFNAFSSIRTHFIFDNCTLSVI